jgi:hypothetical protein
MIKIGFNRGNNQPNGTFLALLQDEECQKYLRLLSPLSVSPILLMTAEVGIDTCK